MYKLVCGCAAFVCPVGVFVYPACFAVAQTEVSERKGFRKWKFLLFCFFCVVVKHKPHGIECFSLEHMHDGFILLLLLSYYIHYITRTDAI